MEEIDDKKLDEKVAGLSKGPDEAPELTEDGRLIKELSAQIPETQICYSDLVRIAMDKQGMTQLQLGINNPYNREQGIMTHIIYMSPRAVGLLLRELIKDYKKFLEVCPDLAKDLAMPQLQDFLE